MLIRIDRWMRIDLGGCMFLLLSFSLRMDASCCSPATPRRVRLAASATAHLRHAVVNATRPEHHDEPPDSMHNSVFSPALHLSLGRPRWRCQSRLSSRLGLPIKHSEAGSFELFFFFFFPPVSVSLSIHCFPGELRWCAETLNTC